MKSFLDKIKSIFHIFKDYHLVKKGEIADTIFSNM